MSLPVYEIKPNVGLGELMFGTEMKPFIKLVGEPEEVENIDEDEEMNTTVLHYWKSGYSIFFVGLANQVFAGIETDHPDVNIFGETIMGRSENEIVTLMKNHGHDDYEVEMEESDKRLSFDISMMDFFFRDDKLIYMNFGVFVDDNGQIEVV